jgi:hypothetical protein
MKPRRMRWAVYVASTGKMKNSYNFLVITSEERKLPEKHKDTGR